MLIRKIGALLSLCLRRSGFKQGLRADTPMRAELLPITLDIFR
jgi:hypothetical protein